jgi:hypothetical protein
LDIFFGECPRVNNTISSFSFERLKSVMQSEIKNVTGIVYINSFGMRYTNIVRSSTKLTCITEVMLDIFIKNIIEIIEKSIKNIELKSERKLLKR